MLACSKLGQGFLLLAAAALPSVQPDCQARQALQVAGLWEAAREDVENKAPEGLQCPGFNLEESCCHSLPIQRVSAWMEMSTRHHLEQLESLTGSLAHALGMLEQITSNQAAEGCGPIAQGLIMPRIEAIQVLKPRVEATLELVAHLVLSGVCSFCFPEMPEDGDDTKAPLASARDGPAAREIAMLVMATESFQDQISESDARLALSDPERRCVPEYVVGLQLGSPVRDAEGVMEAVGRIRTWSLDRRMLSSKLARDAMAQDHFDDDFFETAERLLGVVLAPPARLAHQLSLITMSYDRRYHWSTDRTVARLLWGSPADQCSSGIDETSAAEAMAPPPPPSPKKSAESRAVDEADPTDDPGAAFGLVILISNQTSSQTVEELLTRLEGQRLLILEDTCGTALEALGQNCHGGGPEQKRCLHPVHVAEVAVEMKGTREALAQPHVAWRRHGATRSIAHSAWELAKSLWGDECSAWLADFRPASACSGPPLAAAVKAVPGARLSIVRDMAGLLDINFEEPEPSSAVKADSAEDPSRSSLTWPQDTPLAARLAEYVDFHRRGVAALADPEAEKPQVLVFVCQPYGQCGGHGDRLNGIVTAFLLAVLTNRVFLLDSENPLPMQLLLEPRAIDWQVRGSILATAGLRHHSYHDKRQQFEADLLRIASYPEQLLVVSTNYRMIRSLFEAPDLVERARELGLPDRAPAFLVAEIFDMLFAPTPVLRQELSRFRRELGPLEDGRFIAVHLRTGDISWDPARHGGPGQLQ
ncbi:unnamed protein product, partial [Polarella glacialis]